MAENENIEMVAQAGSDKTANVKKAEKKSSKPSVVARVSKWCKEMKSELKKVQWPTRQQTINNTLVVLACVAIVGVFIWVFDFVAGNAIELLISLLS